MANKGSRGGAGVARSEAGAGVVGEEKAKLETFGEVSAGLKSEIQAFLAGLPPGLLALLKKNGYRFGVGKDFESVIPGMGNEHPRGWPVGMKWKNTDGGYIVDRRLIFATEFKVGPDGRLMRSGRSAGVFRHEMGHAVDSALGTSTSNASSSRQFRAAYNRDVRKMSSTGRTSMDYYLQKGSAGREEAFAESFGAMKGGGGNGTAITKHFPSVGRYMRSKVFKGRARR